MSNSVEVSIVVPLLNEEANVRPLVEAIRRALARTRKKWELILVDDGSDDGTADAACRLQRIDPRVRLVGLARHYGQTTAMQAGFDHARGRVIVSMDGDLQNDPRDIPRLLTALTEGYDLVSGYRVRRRDKLLTRRVPSWIANRLIHMLSGVPIRDNGCSLKAYRRELIDRLFLYSDMHRFIPALAAATAGARIKEIPVRHHPRRRGTAKYGLSRVWKVMPDLLTLKMIRSFRERPLLMFGIGGLVSAFCGLVFAAAAVVSYVAFQPVKAEALVFPGASLLWFGLAFYLLILGLVAEVALRQQTSERWNPPPVAHEVIS